MSYLFSEYEEINGGYVAFGGDPKKEVKSIQLLDESQVLLRVPKKNNMYSVDLKNVAPSGGSGPTWIFDIDTLIKSMNYKQLLQGINLMVVQDSPGDGFKPLGEEEKKDAKDIWNEDYEVLCTKEARVNQEKDANVNSTNTIYIVSPSANAASIKDNVADKDIVYGCADDPNMTNLEEINYSNYDEDVGAEADMTNLDSNIPVSPIPTTRIHKEYLVEQIIGDIHSAPQTRRMTKNVTNYEPKKVIQALTDPSWIKAMQDELLQFKLQQVWTLVDLPYGKRAIGKKWIYIHKKDERGIMIRNKARLVAQGYTQRERIYYDEVFALVARIKAIWLFLAYALFKYFVVYQMDVKSAFMYGKIKRSQDKYVDEISKKFGFSTVKTSSAPIETSKPLLKDENADDVDVHLYRSMIGSLMYLTSSMPDIMFTVYACVRFQVTPKVLHLHAVKRIFRYLKGQPKLGLWYPKDSPFDLEAYTNSDYAGASLDRKSTIGGCQFLGNRLISWQLKKQLRMEFRLTLATTNVKHVNKEAQLHAKVDKKRVIISEASIRSDLRFGDEGGIACLPNEAIFEQLTLMGAKTSALNDFSSTIISAVIYLATNQRFNFSKYIIESMVKNLDSLVKFLMFPRFIRVILNNQLEEMDNHTRIYVPPSHTKNVFANIKRNGKDFSGRVTPLFPTMIVQAQQEVDEGTEVPTNTQQIPTIIQPTPSQPQTTQKIKKPRRKDNKLAQTSVPTEIVAYEAVYKEMYDSVERAATTATGLDAEQDRGFIRDAVAQTMSEIVSKFSNDLPLSRFNTLGNEEDRLKLTELMELCIQLQSRVFALEHIKTNQALQIGSLKRRVKKLKKASKRTYKLKRLYKIGSSGRIKSSSEVCLGDQEDASKQGRIIDNLDADEGVALVDETQGRNDQDMFDIGVFDDEEVVVEKEVITADLVTTAGELVTTTGVEVSVAATTSTISMDDITLAKALAALKSSTPMVKELSVPKAKGIFMEEPKETAIRTTTTVPSQGSKDKGKEKMIKLEKLLNKKDHIMIDEEVARNLKAQLQEELEVEERLTN
nr:hypothetical protein [Tanacetum cinerariifolium]